MILNKVQVLPSTKKFNTSTKKTFQNSVWFFLGRIDSGRKADHAFRWSRRINVNRWDSDWISFRRKKRFGF
tara:strand:- start:508 stop:720 length:213 start_codon:yes stop_codon:yes gene_type:complete